MDAGKDAMNEVLREVLREVVEEARKMPELPNASSHHQVITLHHAEPQKPAPWHSWACVSACTVMMVLTLVMSAMYVDLRRSYDRMDDYLNTIYILVPDLKKMVDAEMKRREKEK